MSSQKAGRRVEHHLSKRDRCSQKEGFLFSAVRGDSLQAVDVPVLVMCPCRRGATSSASQILEISENNKYSSVRDAMFVILTPAGYPP